MAELVSGRYQRRIEKERNIIKKKWLLVISVIIVFSCVACGNANSTDDKNTETQNTESVQNEL